MSIMTSPLECAVQSNVKDHLKTFIFRCLIDADRDAELVFVLYQLVLMDVPIASTHESESQRSIVVKTGGF